MTESAATCPRCGGALGGGICPRCASSAELADDARRRLDETRERLGAWRERLANRLDEFQKKREVLASTEARRVSRMPTARLTDADADPEADADSGLAAAPPNGRPADDATPLHPSHAEPTFPGVGADDAPGAGDDPLGLDTFEAAGTAILSAAPIAEASFGEGHFSATLPIGSSVLDAAEAAEAAPPPAAEENKTPRTIDQLFERPTPPADAAAAALGTPSPSLAASAAASFAADSAFVPAYVDPPSVVLRAAALILDLLILFVAPAAVLTAPASWWGLDGSLAALWGAHGLALLPFAILILVLLATAYVGAFGRTPGMRFAGLRVTGAAGEDPSFRSSLLRALLLPLTIVPAGDALSGTRTILDP